jgi:AcrR family transcriptional regulator
MERMQRAALELFAEQGFEKTTANDIAARAGVTRRTFFRHFPDKREVLFSGSVAQFSEAALVKGIENAEDGATPLRMIVSAIAAHDWDALGPRPLQRRRNAVIIANPGLLERELMKYEAVAVAFTGALVRRGFDTGVARLAADAGVAVCRSAYGRWLDAGEDAGMAEIVEDVVGTLRAAVGAEAGNGRSAATG